MIADYFTDQVRIFATTYDAARRATTVETVVDARVQRTDRLVRDQDGEDRQASYTVFLSPSVSVAISDRLLVETLNGTASGDARRFPILSLFRANGFESHHTEVTV